MTNADLISGGWVASGTGKNKTLTSPSDALSNNDFDTVTLTAGVDQRVLLTGIGAHNGIYFLETEADGAGQNAVLKRAFDADEDEEVFSGMATKVVEGSSSRKEFILTTLDPITVDTTPLTFEGLLSITDATEVFIFGANTVLSSIQTRYLYPGYSDDTAETGEVAFRVPRAGFMQNMYVRHNNPSGNNNAIVYTLMVNSSPTALAVSLGSNTADGNNTSDIIPVAAGDLISIRVTKAASVGSAPSNIIATLEFVR
jgi:hypothetical protein